MRLLTIPCCLVFAAWMASPQPHAPRAWPYEPGTPSYQLGNNYGAYQEYDNTGPYYHNGIDILAGEPRPVYAIASGTVMYVVNDSEFYSGIVIGQPGDGGIGYLYWHLRKDSIRFTLGQSVNENDEIGEVVDWNAPDDFDHVHFSKVRGIGGRIWQTYEYAGDPLADLAPIHDTTAPTIELLDGTRPFRFSDNQSGAYATAGHVSGAIDIVARVSDLIDGSPWKLAPHKIEWRVEAQTATTAGVPMLLDGALGEDAVVAQTLYRNDSIVTSAGDYARREFSYVLTHASKDRPVLATHRAGAWNTSLSPDGTYTVRIVASDRAGNQVTTSQAVVVDNH